MGHNRGFLPAGWEDWTDQQISDYWEEHSRQAGSISKEDEPEAPPPADEPLPAVLPEAPPPADEPPAGDQPAPPDPPEEDLWWDDTPITPDDDPYGDLLDEQAPPVDDSDIQDILDEPTPPAGLPVDPPIVEEPPPADPPADPPPGEPFTEEFLDAHAEWSQQREDRLAQDESDAALEKAFGDEDPFAMTGEEANDALIDDLLKKLDADPADALKRASDAATAAQAAADAALAKAKESHAFWTLPNAQYDPKLQFRFKVVIPGMAYEDARATSEIGDSFADTNHIDKTGGTVWYAKTIDKPGYSLANLTENTWLNAFTMADVLTTIDKPKFKTVSMTLIDPSYPNATRKLVRILRRSGLNEATAVPIAMAYGGSRSKSYTKTVGDVQIMQLNATGSTIETWTLVQAYPQDVSFGKLDYSSSDPVEISITWGYKAFKVDFPEIGKEKAYNYFRNAEDFAGATKAAAASAKKEYSSQEKCKEAAGEYWNVMTDVQKHTAQTARDFSLDNWKKDWCEGKF
tara:strand:+ start:3243 stop:4793 length:1551 start_codon:yes stop_codon:yes gene_type:complete